jgi:hypothetical protein
MDKAVRYHEKLVLIGLPEPGHRTRLKIRPEVKPFERRHEYANIDAQKYQR